MKTRNITGALFWGASLTSVATTPVADFAEVDGFSAWLALNVLRPGSLLLLAWLTANQIQEIYKAIRPEVES